MRRLSSNLTIILKLFIPIVYIVFFGSLLIGSLVVDPNDAPLIANPIFRSAFALVFFSFLGLMYISVFQLKRVDADENFLYINNYKQTFRYPWSDIKKLKTLHFGLFKIVRIQFMSKTSLGKKVTFLPSSQLLKEFMISNPEIFKKMEETL